MAKNIMVNDGGSTEKKKVTEQNVAKMMSTNYSPNNARANSVNTNNTSTKLQNQEKEIGKMMGTSYSPRNNTKEVMAQQQKFANDYNKTQQQYKTEKTETAIKKKLGDLEGKYNYDINTVGYNDNKGNFTLYDYTNDYNNKSLERDNLKNQIASLMDEKSQIDQKDYNALGQYNAQIALLNKDLIERNKELSELEDRIGYQDAYLADYAMQKAKKEKNDDIINQLAGQYESYDDSFMERRGKNLSKITNDMFGAVANVVDIARDLGGEALADAFERGARNYLDSGDISQEEFANMMANADVLREFDAQDPNTLGAQLRAISNQLAYDIANGDDGVSAFIGQGLDSTANFLAQFALLQEAGSLAMMSAQSGTQKYFENLDKGYNKETAFLNGLLSGLISYGTEKIGMDNFVSVLNGTAGKGITAQILNAIVGGKSNLGIVAESIASQGLAEGLEELVEGNLDYALDRITASMANGEPVEYNPGDIFYSFLVGGFSGALMGATGSAISQYNMVVNTREQYNNLRNDLMAYTQIRNEALAKGEDVSQMDQTIAKAEMALNNFEETSKTMGVTLAEDLADNTLATEEINQMLTEAMRPDIEAQVQQNVKLDALEENIDRTAQDFLYAKGINMNVNEFMSMSPESRAEFVEKANKISEAFPNVNIGYSNEIGENAMVIKMEGQTPTIVVNPNGETSVVVSTIHEVVHTLENTEAYNDLFNEVFPDQKAFINKVNELSGGRYKGDSLSTVGKEALTITLTEDMMGDEGAQSFIDHMAKYNTSTAYKLLYNIRDALGLFDNNALKNVERKLTNALAEQEIAYTESGIQYLKGETRKQVRQTLEDIKEGQMDPDIVERQIPLKSDPNEFVQWENDLGIKGNMATSTISSISATQQDINDASTDVYKSEQHTNGTDFYDKSKKTESKNTIEPYIVENIDVLYKNPFAVFEGSKPGSLLLITKALDKGGSVIVLPMYPNQRGNYSDFSLNYVPNTTITSGRSIYGKNDVGTFASNKDYVENFLERGNMLWAEDGKTKDQIKHDVAELLLLGDGHTLVDPSIAREMELSSQLDLIEEKNSIDTDKAEARTFKEMAEDDNLKNIMNLSQEDLDLAEATGFVTAYSDSEIESGNKVNLINGKYKLSVPTDTLVWVNGMEPYYAPITETQLEDEKIAKSPAFDTKDSSEIAYILGDLNEQESLKRNNRTKEVDDEIKAIKKRQADYLKEKISSLDKRFPERYNSKEFDNFQKKYKYEKGIALNQSSKYDGMSDEELIALTIKTANDFRNTLGKLKKEGKELSLKDLTNRAYHLMATLDVISSKITPIKLTEAEEADLLEEYALRKVLGVEDKSRIPNGARKIQPGETPRLDILIGPAGAGKSFSFADSILDNYQSVDLDPDHMKAMYDPGFKMFGGVATPYAETTSLLFDRMFQTYLKEKKYNLLLQGTGKTPTSMLSTIDQALRLGYDVYLHSAETTSEISFASALDRGLRQRITPIDFMLGVDTNPAKTYDLLKDYSIDLEDENGNIITKGVNGYGQVFRYGYKQSATIEDRRTKFDKSGNGSNVEFSRNESLSGVERNSVESPEGNRDEARRYSRGNSEVLNESEGSFSNGKETIQFSSGGENGLRALLNSQNPELRERGEILKDKLIEAVNLEKKNENQNDIWYKTGWIKKSDGKWRFQFFDGAEDAVNNIDSILQKNFKDLNLETAKDTEKEKLVLLPEVVGDNNVLFEMYPELRKVGVLFNIGKDKGTAGMYDEELNLITLNLAPYEAFNSILTGKNTVNDVSNSFFHELQHAIQNLEGFEKGSNLFIASKEILDSRVEESKIERANLRKSLLDSGLSSAQIKKALEMYKTGEIWKRENGNLFTDDQIETLANLTEVEDFLSNPEKELSRDNDLRNEVAGRYTRNLGEIEAREEAENMMDSIEFDMDEMKREGLFMPPETEGYTTKDYDVQYSRRTKVRPETEVVDNYAGEHIQRFTQNIDKSQIFNNAQKNQVREEVAKGGFRYASYINKVEVQRAQEYMKKDGIDKTYESFMSNNNPNMKSVVQGEVLVAELAKKNDPRWEQVAGKLADDASMAGQFLQAYAIMQRLTPSGQLTALRRNLNRMQRDADNRFGNKAPQLELNPKLVDELKNAKDVGEAEQIRDRIYKDLENQVPRTVRDVINSWRYLAMLGNPRTHIRNIVGNGVFTPAVDIKNVIGAGLEKLAGSKLEYKTKAILNPFSEADMALIDLGKKSYDEYKGAIEKGQKYENRGFSDKNKLGRLMNKLADANSALLDKEDYFFAKNRYAESYAQFLKANNLNTNNLTPEMEKRASEYAMLEAQRATYRDVNSVAEWLNQLERSNKKGLKMASYVKDAIVPFTKTPMNIVKRGVRYSPIGLLYTITHDAKELADGKINANAFIDNLSQGLTGSGVALLGALLTSMGLFKTKGDDKDRKQYFDKEQGEQEYTIDLSPFGINGTYTIDWATPVIMPFAIGSELYNVFKNFEGIKGFGDIFDAVADVSAKVMDPVMETSMLSSLQDALKSYSTDGGAWLGNMIWSITSSYIQQMFPTVGGQIARTLDDTRRTVYPNSGPVDKLIRQIFNKIPWASKLNQPYINREGQEEKTEGGNWVGRMFLNMVSPGYYSSKDIDKYDEEMYRLYESTGSIDAFPSSSSKSVTYEKEKYDFTPEQYTQWHKTRWQTEQKYVNQFIDSNTYKGLSDEERVKTIDDIRDYAQKVAKKQFLESQGFVYTDDKDLAEKEPEKYIYDKELTNVGNAMDTGVELYQYYDYLNNAGTKQAEKMKYLEDSDLTEKEKEALWNLNGYKTSYQDYYAKNMSKSSSKSSSKKSSSSSSKTSSTKNSGKSSSKSSGKASVKTSSSGGALQSKASLTQKSQVKNNNFLKAYSNKMKSSKPSSGGQTVVCPKCGNRVTPSNGRCPICGTNL